MHEACISPISAISATLRLKKIAVKQKRKENDSRRGVAMQEASKYPISAISATLRLKKNSG
jgi:hypothetical protein